MKYFVCFHYPAFGGSGVRNIQQVLPLNDFLIGLSTPDAKFEISKVYERNGDVGICYKSGDRFHLVPKDEHNVETGLMMIAVNGCIRMMKEPLVFSKGLIEKALENEFR